MYKRETKKQFYKRLEKERNGKRLTKNQALWELEAHKLRNRLAQAEKRGFVFTEDIVGTRPEKVYQRDIERLKSIKGNKGFLQAGGDVSLEHVTSGAVSIRSSKRNPLTAYIIQRDGQFVVTTNWIEGSRQGSVKITTADLKEIGPDMETMAKLLEPSSPLPVIITPEPVEPKIDIDEPTTAVPPELTVYADPEPQDDYSDNENWDAQESYYQRNPGLDYDNTLNLYEGRQVMYTVDDMLDNMIHYMSEYKVPKNNRDDKLGVADHLRNLINGAIDEFGEDRVAYLIQTSGAEEFVKHVETALFYVSHYSDSATLDWQNSALNKLRDILFQDDIGAASKYDFEDIDNV